MKDSAWILDRLYQRKASDGSIINPATEEGQQAIIDAITGQTTTLTAALTAERIALQSALDSALQDIEDAIVAADAANVAALGDARDQIVAAIEALEAANDASGDDIVSAIQVAQAAIEAAFVTLEAEVDSIGTDIVDAIEAQKLLLDGALQDIEDLIQAELDQVQAAIDATSYDEDSQHVSGSKGKLILGVRNDEADNLTDQNGDLSPLALDAAGRMMIAGNIELGDVTIDATSGPTVITLEDGGEIIAGASKSEALPANPDRGYFTIENISNFPARVGNASVTPTKGFMCLGPGDKISFGPDGIPTEAIWVVRTGSSDATLLVSEADAVPASESADFGYGEGAYGEGAYGA